MMLMLYYRPALYILSPHLHKEGSKNGQMKFKMLVFTDAVCLLGKSISVSYKEIQSMQSYIIPSPHSSMVPLQI